MTQEQLTTALLSVKYLTREQQNEIVHMIQTYQAEKSQKKDYKEASDEIIQTVCNYMNRQNDNFPLTIQNPTTKAELNFAVHGVFYAEGLNKLILYTKGI